jgi:UDPglucose--hexose-1-phosphate uridylyltransferase
MAELRWNPFINDWVMIASHRQDRPQMPKEWCPFCPGSGQVPLFYDVLKYDNDFPALSLTPPEPDAVGTEFFKTLPAYGKCEVILYSSVHNSSLSTLPLSHAQKLVDLWIERYIELSHLENIQYVFIFENRGEVVGVTMPHPHGQIYAYPFLPKKISLEMDAMMKYTALTSKCLQCENLSQELNFEKRIIYQNASFVLYLPFYSEYPYGVQIVSKRHFPSIEHMKLEEKRDLASIILIAAGSLDALFDMPFPYMMCFHNAPVNIKKEMYWHFHIEFFPPMRSAEKQKFNASSETGVWAHCNTTAPEEKAQELRIACDKYLKNMIQSE